MKIKRHFLYYDNGNQVTYKPTPNKGKKYTPQYIVMHYTGATTARSTINWFMRKEAKASAHLLIDEQGDITQFAPLNTITWHAGQSNWYNLNGMNSYSIGIELVNGGKLSRVNGEWICPIDKQSIPDERVLMTNHKNEHITSAWHDYTERQIASAIDVSIAILNYYPVVDVLGHDDIAPERKVDPGPAFPMKHFRSQVLGRFSSGVDIYETTVSLNVRSGPGSQYATVSSPLAQGAMVQVLKKQGRWCWVEAVNSNQDIVDIEGWVYSKFIKRKNL